ncbi:GNAT family protein [Actinosynnema sp. NPDC047251]|uniref:N-acetyltransferase n=1 Tax=Saccharothrix espanaensis (strain ATCC 51144 / DSM 44229 / JCM 9112 / NBRC 15066 / NRRL 15764) TaxID=1179773 RepID=K0JS62_SACES|nr:GNAT family protein [Saccharothrix espanaensis]CCH27639.1 N-acetyltransferase [Saccharothrix espanaensis DSM 44229]
MTWYDRPTLVGEHVRLEPLSVDHAEGLLDAGKDPDIWTWLSLRQPRTPAEARTMVETILADPDRRAWAQVDPVTGEVAGTTSFYDIDPVHRGLYVGYTWIGARWQRTALNRAAKLLLLTRAFEELGAHRVGWHTDGLNERSQRAIERLGATREGVLRSHRIRPDGTLRDTVVYSMTAAEWPAVKARLRA